MVHVYKPRGVCSDRISVEVENGKVARVEVKGGCSGNSQGISSLIVGMDVEEAIKRLEGIKCGRKATSCPDQLSKALRECIEKVED